MRKITVNVDAPEDIIAGYGAGALVRVERDTTSAFAAPTEIATIAVVAGTRQHEYWDTTGTSSHYYRTRYSKASPSAATDYSDYSDALRAGQISAYATIEDLTETMSVVSTDTRTLNVLSDLLVDASDLITQECGRSFFRSPQVSGTETRTYQIVRGGQRSLVAALRLSLDIVSITTLEITDDLVGTTWTAIASGSTGYYLNPLLPETGWPYEDIALSPDGTNYTSFPSGGQVRIVGAFGWAAIPALVKRATVDMAREWHRQGPGGGGPIGMSALGQPTFSRGEPSSLRQLKHSDYKRRSFSYV